MLMLLHKNDIKHAFSVCSTTSFFRLIFFIFFIIILLSNLFLESPLLWPDRQHYHYPKRSTHIFQKPPTLDSLWDQRAPKLSPQLHRLLLANPSSLHHLAPHLDSTRYLVWTCPPKYCAGLGDRFRGILFTYLLSIVTNRRFVIQWPDNNPAPLTDALIPNHIAWDNAEVAMATSKGGDEDDITLPWFACMGSDRNCSDGGHMPNVKYLPAPPLSNKSTTFDHKNMEWDYMNSNHSLSLLDDDVGAIFGKRRIVRIETRLHFQLHYFVSNPHFEPLRSALIDFIDTGNNKDHKEASRSLVIERALMRWLFRPSVIVERKMQKFKALSKGFPGASGRKESSDGQKRYVGIHARMGGDFAEDTDLRFQGINRDKNQVPELLLRCMKTHGYANGNMYLASDSYDFKTILRSAVEGTKWAIYLNDAPAMHSALPHMYPEKQARPFPFPNWLRNAAWRIFPNVWRNGENKEKNKRKILTTSISKEQSDRFRGPFQDIFVDLMMLGNAETVLATTGSGFTRLGLRLGTASGFIDNLKTCEKIDLRSTISAS